MDVKLISGSPLVIAIAGRVDTVTAEEFQAKAEKIMDENPTDVTFDCKELSYVSSSGLRSLLILARKCRSAGVSITLKGLSESVLEVLEVSGFDSFFEIED